MITNTGKEIIGKYLVGQTDSYASYLAIGCGPKPLGSSDLLGGYSTKTSLDFETLRVPIVSKNVLTDAGVTRVTLTAELPTEERYEITEVGVYPSQNNPIPTGLDSQSLILFDSNELWESHVSSTVVPVPLQLGTIFNSNDDINIADKVFYANSNNALFENINYPNRLARHERPRFLDRAIFVRGDSSILAVSGTDLSITSGDHIHLAIEPINLSKNSAEDELRLAFTVVNKAGLGSTHVPNNVKILVQFADSDNTVEYASFVVNLDNGTDINTPTPTGTTNITIPTATAHNISVGQQVVISGITPVGYNGTWTAQTGTTGSTLVVNIGSNPGAITVGGRVTSSTQHNFTDNRYVVVSKKIKELYKTGTFSWDKATTVKIYVYVTPNTSTTAPYSNGSSTAADFYVALDALRLENISSFSNVYGLTAYTVMKTSDSLPIVKSDNTSSFIEFSYVVDVL
jgi:hypothetical protein